MNQFMQFSDFFYENCGAAKPTFLKARGVVTFSINANFSLRMRELHKIVNSMSYGHVG
jgi:hypothetical protein